MMKTKWEQSLLNDILIICKLHDLNFKLSTALMKELIIVGGNVTIEKIIDDDYVYRINKSSLKNRQLMFLEQLVSYNEKRLLHWQAINNNDRQGPKPGWFKLIETKLITDKVSKELPAGL